jgi:hypothetical protein
MSKPPKLHVTIWGISLNAEGAGYRGGAHHRNVGAGVLPFLRNLQMVSAPRWPPYGSNFSSGTTDAIGVLVEPWQNVRGKSESRLRALTCI